MEESLKQSGFKVRRIAAALAQEIEQGVYAPGSMLPPERQLAQVYEVSVTTLRKAMRVLERQGKLVAHPQRGMVVAVPEPQQSTIAQIAFVSSILDADTNEMANGIGQLVDHDRYSLAVYAAHSNLDKYQQVLRNVVSTHPAGIIVTAIDDTKEFDWSALKQASMPVVSIRRPNCPDWHHDYIDVSGTQAAWIIAPFIHKLGLRDVAYFAPSPRAPSQETIDVLRLGGVIIPEERIFIFDAPHGYVDPPDPYVDAREQMAKMLREGFRCELLIAGHDYPAIGAIQAIREAGLRVPEDIRVLSSMRCGPEHLVYGVPRLTTVDRNVKHMGRVAMEVLLHRIAGDSSPQQVHHVSPELIIGETT